MLACGKGMEDHTRKGEAMPFSRCEWAIAERDSRTPATRDEGSRYISIEEC